MSSLVIEHFTDPGCPFAYSAEPIRRRLAWVFGDQILWRTRMVGLAATREDQARKGLTPDLIAATYERMSHDPGMPFDVGLRAGVGATLPACTAVVAAREHESPEVGDRLLRALRVAQMCQPQLLDDPGVLDAAIADAGLDPARVHEWAATDVTRDALAADMHAARHPLAPAAALDRRLADWEGGRRYTCPTYVLHHGDTRVSVIPGFNPIEVYEVVLANCAPGLHQRVNPVDVSEVLAWADAPLATAEVAAVAEISREVARERLLAAGATELRTGTDAFWAPR